MLHLAQFIAALAASLFSGAAIYINWAEHPARMACGSELAATVFAPSYKRAAAMQVTLAMLSFICGLTAWIINQELLWLAGTILIVSVIPFTFIAIMPTNKKLLDPDLDRKAPATETLLIKWGKLHAVRSILGLSASMLFIYLNVIT